MREHQILLMVGGGPMADENAGSIGSTIIASNKTVDPHPRNIGHKHWGVHPNILPLPFLPLLQEPIWDPSKRMVPLEVVTRVHRCSNSAIIDHAKIWWHGSSLTPAITQVRRISRKRLNYEHVCFKITEFWYANPGATMALNTCSNVAMPLY